MSDANQIVPPPESRVVVLNHLQTEFFAALNSFALAVYERCGRHGVLSVGVTEEFGLMLGIPPGLNGEFATPAGVVTVGSVVAP